jgi:Ser/Thr protein kinase RdoA (MazF antagonist)
MMKLSTILKVDSAVDAQGQSHIAERILAHWEHDPGSAQFFRSSTNFVYTFRKGGKRYFLRFADNAERTEAEISAEMELLCWIASKGMAVTTPIASWHGRYVETVETDLGTFYAVVFAALQGAQVDLEELSTDQFEVWGAALGKLHALMHLYQDPSLSARRTWRDHLDLLRSYLREDESGVQAEFDHITSLLSALPTKETNYGLIHGDFELDNLFWQDDIIAVLDFDDCSFCWYVADIAFALRDLFETGVDLSNPSFRAFIRGYSKHYALDEELISHLPMFLRLAKLITYAKLVRAMDLANDQDYPEAYMSLRLKLENWIDNYKASLLS